MRDSLLEMLRAHSPLTALEEEHTQRTLTFVESVSQCTSRSTLEGHVTASAWIVTESYEETLLTHHRKLGRWLQLGGHVEDDLTIHAAALREATEESGIRNLVFASSTLFDVDVHEIPRRKSVPEHYHYDLRFLFVSKTRQVSVSEESNDLQWVSLADARTLDVDESILRMIDKTLLLGH